MIKLLSQLYLEVFKFDNSVGSRQLPPVFKNKVVKQLKGLSTFLINYFPQEFISLISTLFIRKEIDEDIKSKFLEYFQELITSKHMKKTKEIFRHLGGELITQLKI